MEKKILSKEEFLKGISETARVHYPKFYEKFVLSFENIEAIRNATVDDLKELPSMNEKSAQEVYKFFHQDT